MADTSPSPAPRESHITVNYWAAARAAAGTPADSLPATARLTLVEIRERAIALHPDTGLTEVLVACSVLVGDRPVGTRDPADVFVEPGQTVEFLPPFAGG